MNSQINVPAYVVRVVDLANPNRYKPRTFQNADLFSARQAALTYVQGILTQKLAHQVLEVLIELAEVGRTTIGGKHQVVAKIFNQRFQRTMFMQDGKDLLKDMQLDAFTKKSLPPALFKSVGLEQGDDANNSQEFVVKSLTEVAEELAYYQLNGYSTNVPQHQS